MDHVYIFIVHEDRADYDTMIRSDNRLQNVHLVEGPIGLHHMRNYISQFFQEGKPILNMDDDINDILELHIDESVLDIQKSSRYKLTSLSNNDAIAIFERAFSLCKTHNAGLWGIYPVRNGFFMKDLPMVTHDLRFCVGSFWGCFNDPALFIEIEEKEDFYRTLSFYERDKTVIRFNHICVATNYYHNPGGMQANKKDRSEESVKSCHYLLQKWPSLCRIYKGKKNGICEVRLADKSRLVKL